jgi:hypothetical protein
MRVPVTMLGWRLHDSPAPAKTKLSAKMGVGQFPDVASSMIKSCSGAAGTLHFASHSAYELAHPVNPRAHATAPR